MMEGALHWRQRLQCDGDGCACFGGELLPRQSRLVNKGHWSRVLLTELPGVS